LKCKSTICQTILNSCDGLRLTYFAAASDKNEIYCFVAVFVSHNQQSEQGRSDLIARLYCAGVDRSSIANKTTPRLLVARGIVRQQTQKKPGRRLDDCPGVCFMTFSCVTSMRERPDLPGRDAGDSPNRLRMRKQLRRRSDGVECRALRWFRRGECPSIPHRFECRLDPKRPMSFCSATSCKLWGFVAIEAIGAWGVSERVALLQS